MELLYSILINSGAVVLANNERLSIPPTMRFIWEVGLVGNFSVCPFHTMHFVWEIRPVGNFSVYCSSSLTPCASFGI
jgi:hypothetical protein